ncbi:MAG: thioredoxin family protein [bacterium]|nr:thioredoxin family protein [bacterium]
MFKHFSKSIRIIIISILVFLLSFAVYAANGRDNDQKNNSGEVESINWYSFNDGLRAAKENNKTILIDFYTDWCHWCKVMDEKTYANDKVKQLLKDKFIVVKFDAESAEKVSYKGESVPQIKLARELGVTGFPTTFFLEPNGSIIGGQPGYLEPEAFIKLLNFVVNKEYLQKK